MKTSRPKNDSRSLLIAAAAAFCVYFCMYAFRKPFTAAEFDGKAVFGSDLKSTLIISQLIGYMLSKFIGIRIVSELNRKYRTLAILGLIAFSELALLCFAVLPTEYKVFAMFLTDYRWEWYSVSYSHTLRAAPQLKHYLQYFAPASSWHPVWLNP